MAVAFFLVARGERDFEFARGGDGVVVEELVEIAEPEQQQRVRHLLLERVVLPHQRRGRARSCVIGVDAAELDRERDAVERQHVGGGAIVHVVLLGVVRRRR